MKISSVGADLFHADGWMDGRTDMMKLIVIFRNFMNPPKKEKEPTIISYTYKVSVPLEHCTVSLCDCRHQSPSDTMQHPRSTGTSTVLLESLKTLIYLYFIQSHGPMCVYSFFKTANYARIGSVKNVVRYLLLLQNSPKG